MLLTRASDAATSTWPRSRKLPSSKCSSSTLNIRFFAYDPLSCPDFASDPDSKRQRPRTSSVHQSQLGAAPHSPHQAVKPCRHHRYPTEKRNMSFQAQDFSDCLDKCLENFTCNIKVRKALNSIKTAPTSPAGTIGSA
jgi:hypothetical protein